MHTLHTGTVSGKARTYGKKTEADNNFVCRRMLRNVKVFHVFPFAGTGAAYGYLPDSIPVRDTVLQVGSFTDMHPVAARMTPGLLQLRDIFLGYFASHPRFMPVLGSRINSGAGTAGMDACGEVACRNPPQF